MKNIITKIASLAMAFILLGTGTAASKATISNYDSIHTAHSANVVCQYHDGSKINGQKIVNYVADNGYKKCKSCGQITGKIDCSKHNWETIKTGKWINKEYEGFSYCSCCLELVAGYYEERCVTQRCTKCDVRKEKWQHHRIYYKHGKKHMTSKTYDNRL